MISAFIAYWRGRERLFWGWCPACESSPPGLDCWVCDGSHLYGREYPTNIARWRRTWDAAFGKV